MENKYFYIESKGHQEALESSGMPSQFFPFIQTKDHLLFEQMDQQCQYTKMMDMMMKIFISRIFDLHLNQVKSGILNHFPSLVKMLETKQYLFENL